MLVKLLGRIERFFDDVEDEGEQIIKEFREKHPRPEQVPKMSGVPLTKEVILNALNSRLLNKRTTSYKEIEITEVIEDLCSEYGIPRYSQWSKDIDNNRKVMMYSVRDFDSTPYKRPVLMIRYQLTMYEGKERDYWNYTNFTVKIVDGLTLGDCYSIQESLESSKKFFETHRNKVSVKSDDDAFSEVLTELTGGNNQQNQSYPNRVTNVSTIPEIPDDLREWIGVI